VSEQGATIILLPVTLPKADFVAVRLGSKFVINWSLKIASDVLLGCPVDLERPVSKARLRESLGAWSWTTQRVVVDWFTKDSLAKRTLSKIVNRILNVFCTDDLQYYRVLLTVARRHAWRFTEVRAVRVRLMRLLVVSVDAGTYMVTRRRWHSWWNCVS